MKSTIYLDYQDGQAMVYPAQFLGPALFKAYRDACRDSGCTYSAKRSASMIKIDLLPPLLARLELTFKTVVTKVLADAAKLRATALVASRDEAKIRVAELKDKPYPFQVAGVSFLASRQTSILGDVMGLGKTVQALLAIPAGVGSIVVCPASLKGEWFKAVQRWRPDLLPAIIDKFMWAPAGVVHITNYERLPDDALSPPEPCFLIADECHYLKSSKSIRTKRFKALAKEIRQSGGFTHGLTGTPMPNTPMDLLNILQAFDLLGESFGSWPNYIRVMNGKRDYWGKWTWGQPKPEAIAALQRVMLRRRREEVLPDLPTITYQDIEVDVTAAARRASDEARAAMAAAGVDIQAVVEGRQGLGAASESVFTARRMLAEAKIPAAMEIIESYEEEKEPLVVFCAHRKPIEVAGSSEGRGAIHGDIESSDRTGIVERFQRGELSTIALTIKSGGIGFTLTRAAHGLFIDQEWGPADNDQAAARLLRIGQSRGVLLKRLVAPNTIDQDLARILDEKRKNQAIIEAAAGVSAEADPEALKKVGQ